jgi:hypothetical protein
MKFLIRRQLKVVNFRTTSVLNKTTIISDHPPKDLKTRLTICEPPTSVFFVLMITKT